MSKDTEQHDGEGVADHNMEESFFIVPTPTDAESTTNADATAPNSSAAILPISSLELLSPDQSLAVAEYVKDFTSPTFSRTNNSVPEIDIKALMLGDFGVGMSCMAPRFISDRWVVGIDPFKYEGSGFKTTLQLNGKRTVLEMIVERPRPDVSVESYAAGEPNDYLEGRHYEACFLVYDVTVRASFDAAKWYWENFQRGRARPVSNCAHCLGQVCSPRPPFQGCLFVLANKVDLDKAEWQVTLQEGMEFASSIGPLAHFVPISVKTGENCGKASVDEMVRRILFRRAETPPFREQRMERLQKQRERYRRPVDKPLNCVQESSLHWY